MQQIIQNLKSGKTLLEDVPVPQVGAKEILIKTHISLVSLGTEKILVNFGRANMIKKARQQPERVKEVINKMKTDGVKPTVDAVFRKLETPLPLGYCNAGEVIAIGEDVTEFQVGDRVASNGYHAEIVAVPQNLVAKIPDEVSYEEASFTVIGSIGLQGIRLIQPTFGETIVVIGLGLIGLISCQLLKANGCNVIGFDISENKTNIAKTLGIKAFNSNIIDPVKYIEGLTDGNGADAVLITASTKSNTVIKTAANMSRKRGKIVLIGVISLNIDRSDFYEKELTFQVACSYGPGRYDDAYEKKGEDYPLPYVRWTEKRNFEAVLNSMKEGHLDVESLITERVPLNDYQQIYNHLSNGHSIASLIEFPNKNKINDNFTRTIEIVKNGFKGKSNNLAIIGAGNYTQTTVLPALKDANASIKYIVSSGGLSSVNLARKYQILNSSTDLNAVLNDDEIAGVVITTRHNLHSEMTIRALNSGKHVFVEKPLALYETDLNKIISAINKTGKTVTIGFNRRFSPHSRRIKELVGKNPGPMNIIATMNAGYISPDVWVHDPKVGGGRILGEACHYIDLITFLTGSKVEYVCTQAMGKSPRENSDNATLLLKYQNGSLGVINYFSNGNKSYSKERLEIYYQGKNLILDNFRKLYGYGYGNPFGFSNKLLVTRQNKGHNKQFRLFIERLENGGEPLIPFDEIVNTTRSTFAAIESLKLRKWIKVSE